MILPVCAAICGFPLGGEPFYIERWRRENFPDFESGTEKQIQCGNSLFYKGSTVWKATLPGKKLYYSQPYSQPKREWRRRWRVCGIVSASPYRPEGGGYVTGETGTGDKRKSRGRCCATAKKIWRGKNFLAWFTCRDITSIQSKKRKLLQ